MTFLDLFTLMHKLLHTSFVTGAISGVLGAAAIDYHAFQTWKTFDDAKKYMWDVALWRWFQGAVMGGVSAAGISSLL